jgi:hypothetical protein
LFAIIFMGLDLDLLDLDLLDLLDPSAEKGTPLPFP